MKFSFNLSVMKVILFSGLVLVATGLCWATETEENWQWIPTLSGEMEYVDINAIDEGIAPAFNAMNDIIFRLFTRRNPGGDEGQIIRIFNNNDLITSNFNPSHQTRFRIHGWSAGGNRTGGLFRNSFLNRGEFNVIIVDWGAGAGTPNYVLARNRVNEAGSVVAQFIDWLNTNGVSFSSISDADYVEVLFTDIGRLGFSQPIGHANFYPNYGTSQPGCGVDPAGSCGHALVNDFFAESLTPHLIFGAIRCRGFSDITNRNCVISGPSRRMGGEPINDGFSPAGSVYFLTTNPSAPFSQGPR
ncbi:Lipase member H [Pseudolycoriella hygida]|uniref:Lipase member H n=1 Tax=Pseudolycoriella hygida TaxID=35572 RepID=A0A9Q0MYE7_9DIPT|nr:Lipase member H [Pseudolycoriella hygida]